MALRRIFSKAWARAFQITAHPTVSAQQARQSRCGPIAFKAGILPQHVPQRLYLKILLGQRRPLGVQPGQLQAVFHQALHSVNLGPNAHATEQDPARCRRPRASGSTECVVHGHVPQQLLLQYNSALQTLRHVVKRTAQLAQFVLSTGGVKGHPRVQFDRHARHWPARAVD